MSLAVELNNDHKERVARIELDAERHKREATAKNDAALFAEFHLALASVHTEWSKRKVERSASGAPTTKSILLAACEVYGVKMNDLVSERRPTKATEARQVSMYLAKELTGLSYPVIGRSVLRDHSTVVYAHRKIEAAIKTDPGLASKVAQIAGMLE